MKKSQLKAELKAAKLIVQCHANTIAQLQNDLPFSRRQVEEKDRVISELTKENTKLKLQIEAYEKDNRPLIADTDGGHDPCYG